eukprot:5234168-Prymnesium_polylepis.1
MCGWAVQDVRPVCARGSLGPPAAEARGSRHATRFEVARAGAWGRGVACAPWCRPAADRVTALGRACVGSSPDSACFHRGDDCMTHA